MDFGKIKIVEKTFNREKGAGRTQGYNGIKYRRTISNKVGEQGELKETLVVSDRLWEELKLEEYAMVQGIIDGNIVVMVVEDQTEKEPAAKFFRKSKDKETGDFNTKGKMTTNAVLIQDLKDKGIIKDGTDKGNQFLALEDVSKEFANKPDHVKGVYKIVVDENAADEEEEEETVGQENTVNSPQENF